MRMIKNEDDGLREACVLASDVMSLSIDYRWTPLNEVCNTGLHHIPWEVQRHALHVFCFGFDMCLFESGERRRLTNFCALASHGAPISKERGREILQRSICSEGNHPRVTKWIAIVSHSKGDRAVSYYKSWNSSLLCATWTNGVLLLVELDSVICILKDGISDRVFECFCLCLLLLIELGMFVNQLGKSFWANPNVVFGLSFECSYWYAVGFIRFLSRICTVTVSTWTQAN